MSVELRFVPCAEFELTIHAYVDGELAMADSRELLVHLELCDGCRTAVESLRRLIRTHRDARELGALADGFDKVAAFEKLNGALLIANVRRLAALLYELGKAYFLAGNDSKLTTFVHKKAQAIERTRAEGREVARESEEVARIAGGGPRKVRDSVRRADQLLRGRKTGRHARIGARWGRSALDNARRFLEESLILDAELVQPRLYLGMYFLRIDRPDEAIQEYRKILSIAGAAPMHRAMALQGLGNCHGYRRDYESALGCFQQILDEALVDGDERFFTVHLSRALFLAKLERFDRATEAFGDLVERFPKMLGEARRMLERYEIFRGLLRKRAGFRSQLLQRYPMLFAG